MNFIASDEIVEEGIIGSTLNIKDKEFIKFLEDKMKKISANVRILSNSIYLLENFEEKYNKSVNYCNDTRYMILSSMSMLAISMIPFGDNFNVLILGFVIGLEIIGMYYTILALTLYRDIKGDYTKVINKDAK